MDVWHVTWFSLATAAGATAVALPIGVPLAWLLARARFTGRSLVETIVSLPLVMPPVATGLILLMLFGRRGPLGRALSWVGIDVVFTWKAVVIAMAVMGLPLLVRTARGGFEQVDRRLEQVAATLGAGPARGFLTISLPLALRSVLADAVLAFARTLAVAIYSYAETGQDRAAVALLAISTGLAFAALWGANRLAGGSRA